MDQIIQKIIAILRLAQSSTHTGEREAAMARAMAMATRHNLDLAEIQVKEGDQKESSEQKVAERVFKKNNAYVGAVSSILHNYFQVFSVRTRRHDSLKYTLIAEKTWLPMAEFLFEWFMAEYERQWKDYRKLHGFTDTAKRASFIKGIWYGHARKLKEAKEQEEKERLAKLAQEQGQQYAYDVSNRYSLVLTNQLALRQQKAKDMFSDLKDIKVRKVRMTSEFHDGYQRGQQINTPGMPLKANTTDHLQ
jgi:hypothetical protein